MKNSKNNKVNITKQLKNKTILVTGGAGMIGSNLVKRLVYEGFDVFVADNLWRGKKEYLLSDKGTMVIPNKNFHKVDLRDYKNCLKVTNKMDVVVHLADVVAGINYVFSNESSSSSLQCSKPLILQILLSIKLSFLRFMKFSKLLMILID